MRTSASHKLESIIFSFFCSTSPNPYSSFHRQSGTSPKFQSSLNPHFGTPWNHHSSTKPHFRTSLHVPHLIFVLGRHQILFSLLQITPKQDMSQCAIQALSHFLTLGFESLIQPRVRTAGLGSTASGHGHCNNGKTLALLDE